MAPEEVAAWRSELHRIATPSGESIPDSDVLHSSDADHSNSLLLVTKDLVALTDSAIGSILHTARQTPEEKRRRKRQLT